MDEKDVEISVADGMLTIRGEKKFEKDEKKKSYRLIERSYGSFERAVALPPGVDASKVKAKMTKGVLKVEIPKPAAAKSQQVKITAE
jgi:HSP20 family protein